MSPTIHVDDVAKQRLDLLKRKYNAKSYNDLIMRLTEKDNEEVRKMFGSLKGIGPWKREYRAKSKYE